MGGIALSEALRDAGLAAHVGHTVTTTMPTALGSGAAKLAVLNAAGFSPQEIVKYQAETTQTLLKAGLTPADAGTTPPISPQSAAQDGGRPISSVTGDAICASACAYAFLGGVQRSVAPNAKLGLHQFTIDDGTRVERRGAISSTQDLIAFLSAYATKMGVSPDIVRLATDASPVEMHWLTADELFSDKVVTLSGLYGDAPWKITSSGDVRMMDAETISPQGTDDSFSIICYTFPKSIMIFMYSKINIPDNDPIYDATNQFISVSLISSDGIIIPYQSNSKNKYDINQRGDFSIGFLTENEQQIENILKNGQTISMRLGFDGPVASTVIGNDHPIPSNQLLYSLRHVHCAR